MAYILKKPYPSAPESFKAGWSEYHWRGDLTHPKRSHVPAPSLRTKRAFVGQSPGGLALPWRGCPLQSLPDSCILRTA